MKNIATLFLLVVAMQQSAISQSLLWAKSMGGVYSDIAYAVATDAAGSVYTTGTFRLTVDFDPGDGVYELTASGNTDIFVSKLDADGNFLWAVRMGGTSSANGESIAINIDGNCVISGGFLDTVDFDPSDAVFNLTSVNGADMFVVILDDGGNLVWAGAMGGQGFQYSDALAIDTAGNIVIGGYFGNSCDFDPNAGESIISTTEGSAFVVKLEADGTFMWVKHIEGGEGSDVKCFDMTLDDENNILIAGTIIGTVDFDMSANTFELTSVGSTDLYACKLDAEGNFVWAASTGNGSADASRAITSDSDGNVYVTGIFLHGMDFDPGPEVYVLLGSPSDNDTFIWKLSAGGALIWARALKGDGDDISTSVTVDAQGNVYTVGGFDDACDFDPGDEVFEMEPATVNFFDVFISVLNADGDFVWAGQIGSTGYDLPHDVRMDAEDNLYICGYINLTVDMDPTAGEYEITSGAWDAFVLKMVGIPDHIASNVQQQRIAVFPNPSKGWCNLETNVPNKTPYTITDIKGSIIHTGSTTGKITTVDLSMFENGVYFLKVEEQVVKFVKE